MTISVRLFPPLDVRFQTMTTNGRSYSGAPGTVKDVPTYDADVLVANGWIRVAEVGATAQRPTPPTKGKRFFDTTLGSLIVCDGLAWRNPATGAAV